MSNLRKTYCLWRLNSFAHPFLSKASSHALKLKSKTAQIFLPHKSSRLFCDFNDNKVNNIIIFYDRETNDHTKYEFQEITNRVWVLAFLLASFWFIHFSMYLKNNMLEWFENLFSLEFETILLVVLKKNLYLFREVQIEATQNLKMIIVEVYHL